MLTAWFAHYIGQIFIPPCTFLASLAGDSILVFRQAPPWLMSKLLWNGLPLLILLYDLVDHIHAENPEAWAALGQAISVIIQCLEQLSASLVEWSSKEFHVTIFGTTYLFNHLYLDPSTEHFVDGSMLSDLIQPPVTNPLPGLYCQPCGSAFPFLQREVLTAQAEPGTKPITSSMTEDFSHAPEFSLIVDSGASQTCTGVQSDFDSLNTDPSVKNVLKGIAKGLSVEGEGKVTYVVRDTDGNFVHITTVALYVPALGDKRLLSPQGQRTSDGNPITFMVPTNDDMDPDTLPEIHVKSKAKGWLRAPPIQVIECSWSSSNLPTLQSTTTIGQDNQLEALQSAVDVTSKSNQNLSDAQKTLLLLHYRLGHLGFRHIQWLVRSGKLRVRNAKKVADCELPKCAACLYAKMTKRPDKATKSSVPIQDNEMAIRANDLLPGERISMDHYECSLKGRLYTGRKGPQSQQFCGGAIFVDHATGLIQVKHQVSFGAADTIQSKVLFERDAMNDGVIIQGYHTDNGVFSAKAFLEELASKGQTARFSGSGAGHQNGIAERSIRTVVGMARTMMMHAALRHGGGVINQELWPMAMDHAAWIYNRIPQQGSGLSPLELWTRSTAMNVADTLGNCHVWGCPTFILDPKLRKDGAKLPKWAPRSRQGVNMGFSRMHSSLIALVLNTRTQSITPQFHVVFDDSFSTVPSPTDGTIDTASWQQLITSPHDQVTLHTLPDDASETSLADEWLNPDELAMRRSAQRLNSSILQGSDPSSPPVQREMVPPQRETSVEQRESSEQSAVQREQPTRSVLKPRTLDFSAAKSPDPRILDFTQDTDFSPSDSLAPSARAIHPKAPTRPPVQAPASAPAPPAPNIPALPAEGRPQRNRQAPVLYQPDMGPARKWKSDMKGYTAMWKTEVVANLASTIKSSARQWSPREVHQLCELLAEVDSVESSNNPLQALAASKKSTKKDPDTPNLWDALTSDEQEEWLEAMRVEIKSLQARGTWTVVDRKKAGPKHIIPGTWSFKKKRFPDGTFRKYKARWCKRGDIERRKAGPSIDTYSPVVNWSSVRIMLLLGLICGLKTKQVDYTNAFAQADLPSPAYMELPEKFKQELGEGMDDPIIELHKSLYGGALAAKHWFDKLKKGLEDRGFRQCPMDPCLFIRKDMIIVTYIDDCVHWYKDESVMTEFIESLKSDGDKYNWEHTVEGQVNAFLGIDIQYHKKTNRYRLTQTGLIDKVLAATGLQDCNAKPTPCSADGKPLGTDADGPLAKEDWSYPSVVGMLLYLAGNSRPDIAFAVHQCGRFTHAPKASHEAAVIRICRYLKGTRDQGLILKPGNELNVDCFVDADFGGLFSVEDSMDPVSAKSRTGYVIMLAGCPLVWASKLQTTIALSTQNAEYVALSQSLRELSSIRELILDLVGTLGLGTDIQFNTLSKAFEDNAAALQFAKTGKLTLQNKHIATKYHWFRSHIKSEGNPEGWLEIEKVESDQQAADIFTKNLTEQKFKAARKLLCGW